MQLFWLFVILAVLVLGCILYDSNRFRTVHYEIKSDNLTKPFRIAFLSDLHGKQYGENNAKLLSAVSDLAPDAVLIGGDLLTARPGADFSCAVSLAKELASRYPLYYGNGNHEQRLCYYPETYADMGPRYEEALSKIGIARLVNRSATVPGCKIEIVGCEIDRQYYQRFCKIRMEDSYLENLLPKKDKDKFTILLAHNPDYMEAYTHWGADLVLSGHVHGGVVRIPGIGGVISTNFRLFPHYDGGRFQNGGTTMIISRGLGAHTIPLRLFNPGELVCIDILPLSQSQPEQE